MSSSPEVLFSNDDNPYIVGRTLSSHQTVDPGEIQAQRPVKIPKQRSVWKRIVVGLLLLVFIPILVIGIWDVRNFSSASNKLFHDGNLLSALGSSELRGTERNRVNIMVVGYSADDANHNGAMLTDSIMIVSLSTDGHNSYMLSVPRDLYVSIPEYNRAKINEAYQDGQNDGFSDPDYAAGGIGLLEKTISDSLGIPVDYYALVDYAAVRGTTDALGGITVTIKSTDPRGIYDPNFQPQEGGPLQLTNGTHLLDGQTALRLTRARGAAGGYGLAQSDFDRTKNQQQVFTAIKDKISIAMLLNPTKNATFLNAVAENVHTDVELHEALPLFKLFHSIPSAELDSVTLRDINGKNYLSGYITSKGQSALIPAAGINDYSDIRAAIDLLNQ